MPFNLERSTVNVKEFLEVIDLTNINIIKINGERFSYGFIENKYGQYLIDNITIQTLYKTLTTDDIRSSLMTDDIDSVVDYVNVEHTLPNSPQYISIELHIKIKERR